MATDKLRPSRLVRGLDARIATAKTTLDADCLRAEKAMYLARHGDSAQVSAILGDLRRRYDDRQNIRLSVLVNLAEGLASHFSDMGKLAADKVRRAQALSEMSGLAPLRALTAAWSANMDYVGAAFESMAVHAARALELAGNEEHGARSRVSLVVAQAYHFAGRFDLAQPWYESARQHAVDEGDEATLGALMHNSSWLRAMNLRLDVLLGGIALAESEHALMSADSVHNFDRMVGTKSLQALTPMLRAQILALMGRPAEAIELFDKHFDNSVEQGAKAIEADMLADRAWCHLQIGDLEAARRHADSAVGRIDPAGHCIDRAVAHRRLAQVFDALNELKLASTHDALATDAWAGHRAEQQRILGALANPSLPVAEPRSAPVAS